MIKKHVIVLFALVGIVVLLSSCATSNSLIKNLPPWVVDPPVVSDGYYGVGYANNSNQSLSLRVAETRARADISNQIRVSVQEIVQVYSQESKVGNESQVLEFAEMVTRQVTDQTLNGTQIVSRFPVSDGGVWVLAKYDTNALKGLISKSIEINAQAFSRSEDIAFAEWKADTAEKYMEKLLLSNPPQSSPVTEGN
jgi:hypothetical protein